MLLGEGDTFAGYRVLRVIGSGGMGEVYLAEHPRLPRRDALKLLRSDISADPEYRSRFEREAALASTLWHPNIVGLHDRGDYDGHLWITMDFVDGANAADLMRTRYPDGMPPQLALKVVSAVAGALDYAHKQALLHRDVKPANIIVTHPDDDGESRIMLADFGIARNIDEVSGLTATNMTVGTIAYAAPEQLMGEPVDGRADQYALAATAYHLLTGSQLYPHSNAAVVIGRHLNADPPRLANRRPELAAYDPAFTIALAKKPSDRFARTTDFARALTHPDTALNTAEFAAAPTQTAPTTPRGFTSSPPQTPTSAARLRRTRTAIIAAAISAIVLVAGAIIWHPWSHSPPGPSGPPPNTGPLTGTYNAEFGPEIELGSGKSLNAETSRATMRIRSACAPAGCVALANAISGPFINQSIVFDQVGDRWIAVSTAPSNSPQISSGMNAGCEQGLSPEVWETVDMKTQPGGAANGSYQVLDANNCNTTRTITLTRTGDVDTTTIDDPAALPPRKATPGSEFHGHYKYTHGLEGRKPVETAGSVDTYCLRTVERCMSYFYTTDSAEPFVFSDGQWIMNYNAPVPCHRGGVSSRPRVDRTAILQLPDPATDPITILTGTGHDHIDDPRCITDSSFDLRFERTGDT